MKLTAIPVALSLLLGVTAHAEVQTSADREGNQMRLDALYEYANLAVRGSKLQSDKDNALLTALFVSQGISQKLPSMITNSDKALATCRELASESMFMIGNATPDEKVPLLKFLQADCLRNVGQKRLIPQL